MSGRRRLAAFLAVLLILSLPAPAVYAGQTDTWTCPNGHEGNTGKFCTECGASRAEAEEDAEKEWTCPQCGTVSSGKFCPECGMSREEAEEIFSSEWICPQCGTTNSGKFCTECGTPKEEAEAEPSSDEQPASDEDTDAGIGTDTETDPEEGSTAGSAADGEPEVTPAKYSRVFTNKDQLEYLQAEYDRAMSVQRAENGIFWVRDSEAEKDFIFDENGSTIYEPGCCMEDVTIFDDYILADSHLLLDYAGNKVFDLTEEGYEYKDVVNFDALDADLLLVSEYINTFSETATYYYSLNIRTGEKIRLDEQYIPHKTGLKTQWLYLGDGYFLNACPHSGFGGEHHMLNLSDGSVYLCYDEATGDTKMPDYYFWNNLNIDNKALYYCDTDKICILNGETGGVEKTPIIQSGAGGYVISGVEGGVELTPPSDAEISERSDFVRVESDEHTGIPFLYRAKGFDQNENETPCLMDIGTRVVTPVGIFSSCKIYQHDEEGNYLLHVTNAGGGQFISVINKDGDLMFEPFPYSSLRGSNLNYFAVNDEDNNLHLYNWAGEELFSCDNNGELWFGDHSVIFSGGGTPRTLLKADGTLQILEEAFFGKEAASEDEFISGNGYRFWNYDFRDLFVSEDGEYRRFVVPPEEGIESEVSEVSAA